MSLHILFTSRTLLDSLVESLCLWKIFACGKIKSGRKSSVKKKGRQSQRREKGYHSVEKRKKYLCESDWYWQSSTLTSRFRTKKSLSNQKLPYMMLKTRFPFLYASTSLGTKTLTISSNRNFESCMSIHCLASRHIFRFFHFCRGFFLCFWQLCSFLCRPPQHSLKRSRQKLIDMSAMDYFSREILILRNWRQEGPVVLLVYAFRKQDNLLAWRWLFANLNELNSRIWFWEEYNHYERIYRVFRSDRSSSKFRQNILGIMTNESVSGNFDIWNICPVGSIYATSLSYY